MLKEWRKQHDRERVPGAVKKKIIRYAAMKAFRVEDDTTFESEVINLLKTGRIVVP
jgi:hypothetical protein